MTDAKLTKREQTFVLHMIDELIDYWSTVATEDEIQSRDQLDRKIEAAKRLRSRLMYGISE
jgi:hypothetical protein